MRAHCEKFDRRLQRVIDLGRDPRRDLRLARHAARCDECRRALAAHGLLVEAIALRRAEMADLAPASLAQRLAAASIEATCEAPVEPAVAMSAGIPAAWRNIARWSTLASLAAAMLLVVWSGLAGRSERSPVGADEPARPPASLGVSSSTQVSPPSDIADHAPSAAPSQSTVTGQSTLSGQEIGASRAIGAPSQLARSLSLSFDAQRRAQLLAAETGWHLAAAVRALPGLGSDSPAIFDAGQRADRPEAFDSESLKAWTDSMSDAWGRWLDAAPPAERQTRS